MKFNTVVCGGTFDHFHKGHREFLRHVLSISNKAVIGLTSDIYIKAKNDNEWIEDYSTRKRELCQFLDQEKAKNRVEIEPIDDIFIPKIWENLPIEAIIVSKNTISGAEKINLKRKEQGRYSLKVEIAPLVKDQGNEYISSGRIRKGEINREGKLYVNPLWIKKNLILPKSLRKEFRKPFGELFRDVDNAVKDKDKNFLIITVGDITTKIFNDNSLGQNISVIDFKVAREKKFYNILELGFSGTEEIFNVDNPAGCITSNLFIKLAEIFKSDIQGKMVLQVNGEEDLTVLPLVLFSPLSAIIYYGQPCEGVVKVVVSEESKKKAYDLMSRFKASSDK